jgi:hypothetical protein
MLWNILDFFVAWQFWNFNVFNCWALVLYQFFENVLIKLRWLIFCLGMELWKTLLTITSFLLKFLKNVLQYIWILW